MNNFIVGQRWISRSESELGLGLIVDVIQNRVTVLFLACNEQRFYASDNAPLTRVQFSRGEIITTDQGMSGEVVNIIEREGLFSYQIRDGDKQLIVIEEMALSHHLQFNKPQERLIMGQAEAGRWFSLRYDTWQHRCRLQQSSVSGLLGARASLIPHQLYIAHEVAQRERVRIMLADEVGLGKTIEAGLILHQHLLLGLSSRILIIVPESLLHQWLVEMLRRFNLRFSLLDEGRCEAIEGENPFLTTQLVLCSLDFFEDNSQRKAEVISAGWDMVIIDEAHHLQWQIDNPSDAYCFVEQLSLTVEGLVLLTATPEQLGKQTHFAQLRLLDPGRFHSFEVFQQEEKQFKPIAELAEKIMQPHIVLSEEDEVFLKTLVDMSVANCFLENLDDTVFKDAILAQLVDRHGTGRVLFRNSRHVVKGFPERELHCYPLEAIESGCYIIWIVKCLRYLIEGKVLLICKTAETVMQLQKILRDKHAIKVAIFHEGMSIIERDRAAAYFSDEEAQVKVLLCSEIGSEGRNFQFVHHLILLDLPENPDLLQQRIGRLDRIGQQHIIQIHVPYILGSIQHSLCRWYDEGLGLFQKNSNAASEVYSLQKSKVKVVCMSEQQTGLNDLVTEAQRLIQRIEAEMHASRDVLLELNSFREQPAQLLINHIRDMSQSNALWTYMEDIFDCFGVESEYHSTGCAILQAGELERISYFPYLPEDGMTVTVNRQRALEREDMQYLTWEHPMVLAAMDLVLSDYIGNAVFSVVKHSELEAGQYLLECLFIVECSAPAVLKLSRFLPVTPLRFLINQQQIDLSNAIAHQSLKDEHHEFENEQITDFMSSQHDHINILIRVAEKSAKNKLQDIIDEASVEMLAALSSEIKRLEALARVNPNIKSDEINILKERAVISHDYINSTQLRLDAVRFIISS